MSERASNELLITFNHDVLCEQDQLIDVFKPVGQVVGFRLVFDRETGKPRGYGFCEFAGTYFFFKLLLRGASSSVWSDV